MATHPIDMTDVTRPNGVEGRMVDPERCWDRGSDTYPISQVYVWIDYKIDDVVIEAAKKLTLTPGLINQAVDKAYDVALDAEVLAQKAAHPEYTDEQALDAAQAVVTKANSSNIWTQLVDIVKSLESAIADQRAANPEFTDDQASEAAIAAIADTVAQSLLSKNTGAQDWGVRLLKYAWNGKGL